MHLYKNSVFVNSLAYSHNTAITESGLNRVKEDVILSVRRLQTNKTLFSGDRNRFIN